MSEMRGKQCILDVSNGLSIYIFITNTLGSCSYINRVSIYLVLLPAQHIHVQSQYSWAHIQLGVLSYKNRFGSSSNKLRNMTETKTIKAFHFRYVS